MLFAGRIDSETKRAEVTRCVRFGKPGNSSNSHGRMYSWTAGAAKMNSPAYLDFSKANGGEYETTMKVFSSFVANKCESQRNG